MDKLIKSLGYLCSDQLVRFVNKIARSIEEFKRIVIVVAFLNEC